MAQLDEYVEYLAKDIGARPAGTEEEQQAALYITEQLQKDTNFTTAIEDFTSSSNVEGLRGLFSIVAVVAALIAMVFPVTAAPMFVIAGLAAAAYTLEAFDKPILSRAFARGASQNVVAKYQPNPEDIGNKRTRKVVLLARYDSGKVKPAIVEKAESFKLPLGLICVGAMIALAVLVLLHAVFRAGGVGAIVFNVITILVMIVAVLPGVKAILYRIAPYNEGANDNAAGVGAVMEVARRIASGSVSEADLLEGADGVVVHGEEAALASGLVPEGARLVYEASQISPNIEDASPEARLAAAKAAIAALTGKSVTRYESNDIAGNLVGARVENGPIANVEVPTLAETPAKTNVEQGGESASPVSVQVAAELPEAPSSAVDVADDSDLPSWFVAAQSKVKRPANDVNTVQRSHFASALEAAERDAQERGAAEREERERAEKERAEREAREAVEAYATRAAAMEPAEEPVVSEESTAAESFAFEFEAPEQEAADARQVAFADDEPVAEAPAANERYEYDPQQIAAEASAFAASVLAETNLSGDQARATENTHRGFGSLFQASDESTSASQGGEAGTSSTKSILSQLPSIHGNMPENNNPSRSGMMRKLRTDIPSLSGVIPINDGQDHYASISTVGSYGETAPADAEFADEEPANAAPYADAYYDEPEDDYYAADEASYVEDEEPSDIATTQEPEYVEMPKSRISRFFDRFRSKKAHDEMEETPQEWLEVDEDFDARTVGRDRGGWESFRSDEYDDYADDYFDDGQGSDAQQGNRWQGGGFSRVRLGRVDMRSGDGSDVAAEEVEIEPAPMVADDPSTEIERIYHFRNPAFNTEVWFVAIGSEIESHDGSRAFLDAHRDELRGALVVEVEALGNGTLSLAMSEGTFMPVKTSSRAKRRLRQVTGATGMSLDDVSIVGTDSISSTFIKNGVQSMHIFGAENDRPAMQGSRDDVLENVDFELLEKNVDYLMELVKSY